jgi:hypothetical protein
MAAESSLDIVSGVEMPEVANAVDQSMKEIGQRYDFRGSVSKIELNQKEKKIIVVSDDGFKLKSVLDVLQGKLVKRGVALQNLVYGKEEKAAGGTVRQEITLQQGIPQDKAKEIVKKIKNLKLKVQAQIQGDQVRVSGKKKDDLQSVMAALRQDDFGLELKFTNYR